MTDTDTQQNRTWKESFSVYIKPQCITMLFLGFSAGLPFLLVFGTLNLWLKDLNISTAIIGYFAFIGITYSIKVAWSPIVDKIRVPILTKMMGHRRSWILVAQAGIAIGLVSMSLTDPTKFPFELAIFGLLVAFSSATQDISIDAFRIEAADADYQAAMSATYVMGYRLGILAAGAGSLYIAKYASWPMAYMVMAGLVGIGVVTVLLIREPTRTKEDSAIMPRSFVFNQFVNLDILGRILSALLSCLFIFVFLFIFIFFAGVFPVLIVNTLSSLFGFRLFDLQPMLDNRHNILLGIAALTLVIIATVITLRNQTHFARFIDWVIGSVIGPLIDFFYRFGWLLALMIIFLVLTYRISDIYMGSMATVLYGELDFDKATIANITKVFGLIMTILGTVLGGVLVMRYGIMRPLLIGAVIVAVANIFFVALAITGKNTYMLTAVITMDNLSGGFAIAVFIAYLSSLVNRSYTATQYALFSSLMTLPGKILSGFSGEVVEYKGYPAFFTDASLFGLPAILIVVTLILLRHMPENLKQDQIADEANQSTGIRGWLILPTLGLIATPIIAAVILSKQVIPAYMSKIVPNFLVDKMMSPTSAYYDTNGVILSIFALISLIVSVVLAMYMLKFLLRKSAQFPKYIQYYYAFNAIIMLSSMYLYYQMQGAAATEFAKFYNPSMQLIVIGLATFAWIPYFIFSKRVKNTFIK